MAIEDMIGGMMQLPVAFGNMYSNMYAPMYTYGQSQGSNMSQLGGQGMNLYGNLAGQQASMYQSELPFQMEQAKWNSIAPVLGGLLSQFGMGGGGVSPIQMSYNRPDVMGGYQQALNQAYSNARGYDGWMNSNLASHQQYMPPAPWAAEGGPKGPAAAGGPKPASSSAAMLPNRGFAGPAPRG